jgi:hypothetical protein
MKDEIDGEMIGHRTRFISIGKYSGSPAPEQAFSSSFFRCRKPKSHQGLIRSGNPNSIDPDTFFLYQ